MSRVLELKAEAKRGQIHDFSAIIDGTERISGSGAKPRSWQGQIADGAVKVTVWATGVPGSQWELTVDLPGTADDFTIRYTLTGAVQKVEFSA